MIKVDQNFIISIRDQTEKQAVACQEVGKLNMRAEFYLSALDPENGEKGCFNSHVAVAREALKRNCKSILVCEDDVRILPYNKSQIAAINAFIENKSRYFDLLYLGLILGKIWFCGSRSIVRARGAGLHGYILTERGMQKMANYVWQGNAIDEVVKRDMKCYSVYPMIAVQFPEPPTGGNLSGIRNQRKKRKIKDEKFWEDNCQKQKRRLLSNIHRTILDFFCMPCK